MKSSYLVAMNTALALVSVTSARDIERKGRIFVSIENLTDEVTPAFMFSGEIPEEDNAILLAPRTLMAGVEFEF